MALREGQGCRQKDVRDRSRKEARLTDDPTLSAFVACRTVNRNSRVNSSDRYTRSPHLDNPIEVMRIGTATSGRLTSPWSDFASRAKADTLREEAQSSSVRARAPEAPVNVNGKEAKAEKGHEKRREAHP